jgi:DNA-binding CsgD family transcriptional regulator
METMIEARRAAEDFHISSDVVETIVERRVGPGILLLSVSLQLLYMNQRAFELSRKIMHALNGKTATGVLPTVVTALCAEVATALQARTNAKDWEQTQLKCVVNASRPPVLLRALGLPDRGGILQARILILLEEVSPRKARAPEQARELFRLTSREHGVVSYLAKGYTNKEIANALKISEQTVKEHIKHIMEKTGSTTRTGILVRIFNS